MESDDEYEYEYHESETETFYLNLDLSSVHGILRPPRRRQPSVSLGEGDDDTHYNPRANNNPSNAFTPLDSAETDALPAEQIQILGLHTANPIVSYYNQVFSCSWVDQIGTELIFCSPDSDLDPDNLTPPLQQGAAFELLAANSVKILGRKANLTSSAQGASLAQDADESTTAPTAGSGPPGFTDVETPGVPRRAAVSSNQARFLEQLQSIKHAKGEMDTVRTVMSSKRTVNLADRLRGWARTEEQLAHIQRLNEQAKHGDTEASVALQRLFAHLKRAETADTEGSSSQP